MSPSRMTSHRRSNNVSRIARPTSLRLDDFWMDSMALLTAKPMQPELLSSSKKAGVSFLRSHTAPSAARTGACSTTTSGKMLFYNYSW